MSGLSIWWNVLSISFGIQFLKINSKTCNDVRNKWIINSFLQVHLLATQDQYLKLKTLSIIKFKLLTLCYSYVYFLTRPIFLNWSNSWSILKNHFQEGFESPGENPYDLLNVYATYWSFYHHSTPSLKFLKIFS